MGVWDLFPPPSSSFGSVVRQKRDLQPLPYSLHPVLRLCSWGVGGEGSIEEWGIGSLWMLVEEPRTEAWILSWEASSPRRQYIGGHVIGFGG